MNFFEWKFCTEIIHQVPFIVISSISPEMAAVVVGVPESQVNLAEVMVLLISGNGKNMWGKKGKKIITTIIPVG